MTNEEKAREISDSYYMPDIVFAGDTPYYAAMEMAEWKEQQMVDKACEWLKDNLASFWQCKFYDDIAFIDDFKKAMKGGGK